MGDPSAALVLPTWLAAIASLITAVILALTLKIAWCNLTEFKSSERVRRTTDLFFKFYSEEYIIENNHLDSPPLRRTPFMAINSVINAPTIVRSELLTIAHNYLEAIAAMHWKNLIDSDLYFDSFAILIVRAYEPLTQRLTASGDPLTPDSRIPKLYADAKNYLAKRQGNRQR